MRLKYVWVPGWVVCCAVAAPAPGQEVLDQQFAPPTGQNLGAFVNEGSKLGGQTFTAALSGRLSRVATDFERFERAQTDFEFTLHATSGGLPTGPPLATEVLPYTAVPTTTETAVATCEVFFDPAPLVQAGRQYAIVVQSPLVPPGFMQGTGVWGGSTTPPGYLLGVPVTSDDGVIWNSRTDYDLFFRTYVTIPEPAVITPLAVGFALLMRRRRPAAGGPRGGA